MGWVIVKLVSGETHNVEADQIAHVVESLKRAREQNDYAALRTSAGTVYVNPDYVTNVEPTDEYAS